MNVMSLGHKSLPRVARSSIRAPQLCRFYSSFLLTTPPFSASSASLTATSGLHCRHGGSNVAYINITPATRRLQSASARQGAKTSLRDVASKASVKSKPRVDSTTDPVPLTSPKKTFPERLLVYHAGTGRTVFVGCSKVTTIFVFGFFCTVLAPAYYYAPDEPSWMAPAIIAAGSIPLLYVALTTKPFTTYVHLVLPAKACTSRESLTRWLNGAGRDLTLDFTTMRFMGLARVTRTRLQDLRRRTEGAADISNISVHTAGASWRTDNPVRTLVGKPRRFHVSDRINHSNETKLWTVLRDRIPAAESKRKLR